MDKMTICQTNIGMPQGAAWEAVRSFLFNVLVGLGKDDDRAWKRFWRKVPGAVPEELLFLELIFPRNAKFHRKFFALLPLVLRHGSRVGSVKLTRAARLRGMC